MSFLKKYLQIIFLALNLVFLYFNLTNWQMPWLGWVLFVLYFVIVGVWWQDILRNVFGMNKKSWVTKVFAWFAGFSLLGLVASVCVVFYTLTTIIIFWCFVAVSFISICLWLLIRDTGYGIRENEHGTKNNGELILFKKNITYHLSLITYLLLWLVAIYILSKSSSVQPLQTPWQTISKYYLPIFFVLTVLSGIFLFVKFKTKTILLILVLQSLLLHSYLPLTQQNPWGGDVWRHLAMENRLQNGELILPVLFGPSATWQEVAKIDLPIVFQAPQKYSYGHLWGTSVLLSDTLKVDLLIINKWLGPIIWSLVLPFLLFKIGWLIFDNRRKGLWLAWLSLLAFPLQAQGALTLPIGFDFLLFLFVLMLWLIYLRDGTRRQMWVVLFFAFLMLFSYSLYFILIWVVIILSLITYHLSRITYHVSHITQQKSIFNLQSSIFNKAIWTILIFASLFIIPIIELISKVSFVPENFNLSLNLKQLLGQFSGWFYASAIRPHDILSGNIIFNHTPDYAFVLNIFNFWRWWLIPAMIVLWVLVGLGVYRIFKIQDLRLKIIGLLFSTVFGGYLLGWFVLDGDRLLTRRLDVVLAFLILVLIIYGFSFITYHISHITYHKSWNKVIVITTVILLSWFTTFTYASGPDMRVVSGDEFNVAGYINDHRSQITDRQCILADTWILLPLEGLSSGSIVGGGFPLDYNFAQPELTVLFNEMNVNPRESVLKLAHEKTGAGECWFVTRITDNADYGLQMDKVLNSRPMVFGNLDVWKEVSSTPVTAPLKKGKK